MTSRISAESCTSRSSARIVTTSVLLPTSKVKSRRWRSLAWISRRGRVDCLKSVALAVKEYTPTGNCGNRYSPALLTTAENFISSQVLSDDGGAGENAAGAILDAARELARIHLGEGSGGQEQCSMETRHRRPVYRNFRYCFGAVAFGDETFVAVGAVCGRAGAVDALSDSGDSAGA